MKIAYYISNFPKLSETFVSREVLVLNNKGVDLELFASSAPNSNERGKLPLEINELIVKTTYFSGKKAVLACLKNPILFLKYIMITKELCEEASTSPKSVLLLGRAILLSQELKKRKIGHVHAHWPYASMVVYVAHLISKVPFSISIHAHEVFHENGHFKRVFPEVKFASFCNEAAMKAMIELYPNCKEKAHLIYHGVNLNNFPALEPNVYDGKEFNVISAGRLTKTKGFDRLIRACAKVRFETGVLVELTILGEGVAKDELLTLAKELNFDQYLHMPGWVGHNEVKKHFQKSHLFALLANVNYHDGLPNVLLEAMACQRPAIVSPLPAANEAINNTENGFILDGVDDYQGFKKHLIEMTENPEMAIKLSKNARQTIEKLFRDELHIQKMIDLFFE